MSKRVRILQCVFSLPFCRRRKLVFVCMALAVSVWSHSTLAQSSKCAGLSKIKTNTYGFHPSELNDAAQTAKSAEMDTFWTAVERTGPDGVQCLREMIRSEKTDSFFLFDASQLLYSLDKSSDSLQVIAQGFPGWDLNDVQIPEYIRAALRFNRDGVDISPLASKYLYFPKVDAYVPQHSLKLGRDLGAILLFGSMAPSMSDAILIPALTADQDYVRSTAALFLAMNMTPDDFRALRGLRLADLPASVRQQVESTMKPRKLPAAKQTKFTRDQVLASLGKIPNYDRSFSGVAGNTDFMSSAMNTLTETDIEAIRNARQRCITGVSDEVIDEYVALSQILLAVIVRLNLYSQAREGAGDL